ncbi:MAG: class II aldolase/adducin family protein [Aureliella sp.]
MPEFRNVLPPRDEIVKTIDRIYRYRMTTTSGGNLSIRDHENNIWITPARIDKGNLSRDDIVCVQPDGSILGRHKASSEFPFHRAIYEARPDLRAVVHAHPAALVAFSICKQAPATRIVHQSYSVCGKIGFANYACPGSEQLGEQIAHTFADQAQCVILENHGVVTAGSSLGEAFQRFEAFEFAGKTLIKAKQLGEIRQLNEEQLQLAQNRGVVFESFEFGPASERECELRSQLCRFVQRGCRQRLLISTEGSYSARIDDETFLITPTGKDRELLTPDELVLVRGNRREVGKLASRAARAHQAIYHTHPHVQSIVFAHPVNATAFSITDVTLNVRTIPESYVFLSDVKKAPYGIAFGEGQGIASHVSQSAPATLLENDGVLVTGANVLDTFDRLEVLESTAEAIINAQSIGPISMMPDEVIDELRTAFDLK